MFTCINPVTHWATVNTWLVNQASCGTDYYLLTQAEFDAYTASIAATPTPSALPELTITGATQIAASIAVLWGLAFVFRALFHFLKSTKGDSQND